jgi:hypothetical protein
MASLIARVKNLLLSPKTEWDVIGLEQAEPRKVVLGYVAPLAAMPAAAMAIGLSVLGVEVAGERYRAPILIVAASSAAFFLLTIAAVYAFAFVIDWLAPRFGAERNYRQAFKVAAYSITAAMVAGIVTIVPALHVFALLDATYSLYLLFVGAPKLMQLAPENVTNYAIVATASAIVVALAVGLAAMAIAAPSGVLFPQLSKLPTFGLNVAQPGRISEATLALPGKLAADGVGSVASGDLKDVAPLRLVGLKRVAVGVQNRVDSGKTVSVEAEYRKDRKHMDLEVTLSSAIADVIGFGGPATSEYDRETSEGYSRRRRVGEALIVEEWDAASRTGSYGRLIDNRFYVKASGGGGVRPRDLQAAVLAVGADALAQMEAAD